jgi:hypothetical protein
MLLLFLRLPCSEPGDWELVFVARLAGRLISYKALSDSRAPCREGGEIRYDRRGDGLAR